MGCTKFCRIALDDDSTEHFILWLCDHAQEQTEQRLAAYKTSEPVWYDPVESQWGWDAPRHRMAKLLWQFLHGGASDEEFRRRFTFGRGLECQDAAVSLNSSFACMLSGDSGWVENPVRTLSRIAALMRCRA